MNNEIIRGKTAIEQILNNNNADIIECFEFDRKIEYMISTQIGVISLSFVDDMSYDFTVFNLEGDNIIYNHTVVIKSISELNQLLNYDLCQLKQQFS